MGCVGVLPYTTYEMGWELEWVVRWFFIDQGLPRSWADAAGPAGLAALLTTFALHPGLRRGLGLALRALWAYAWTLVFAVAAAAVFLWPAPLTPIDLPLAGGATAIISLLIAFLSHWDRRKGRAPYAGLAALIGGGVGAYLAWELMPSDFYALWYDFPRRCCDLEDVLLRLELVWQVVALVAMPAALLALLLTRLPSPRWPQRSWLQWIDRAFCWLGLVLLPVGGAAVLAASPFYTAPPLILALATGDNREALRLVNPQLGIIGLAGAGAVAGLLGAWLSGQTNPRRRLGLAAMLGAVVGSGTGLLFAGWIMS